jgi:hypothetical protein
LIRAADCGKNTTYGKECCQAEFRFLIHLYFSFSTFGFRQILPPIHHIVQEGKRQGNSQGFPALPTSSKRAEKMPNLAVVGRNFLALKGELWYNGDYEKDFNRFTFAYGVLAGRRG